MSSVKIIELKESILEDNDRDADALRAEMKAARRFYLNIMSSPGSGKTSCILRTAEKLKERFSIGVMEADIDASVDAETVAAAGFPAVQLHTGGMCHLDADMSRQGIRALDAAAAELGLPAPEFVILENVGNLVCPAEFDTGAELNAVILSVPEGDDKPLKYPLMFEQCGAALVNKIDAAPAFDFDFDKVKKNILFRKPDCEVFFVSAKKDQGFDEWCEWLAAQAERALRG
ncbi:MAG: hydrogenase nickel incorporation protein HypB [Firmicutes bacterium]|nr:hydrogenase nickel incorporation protein HypB [Bacillota bacterium]